MNEDYELAVVTGTSGVVISGAEQRNDREVRPLVPATMTDLYADLRTSPRQMRTLVSVSLVDGVIRDKILGMKGNLYSSTGELLK